MKLNQHLEHPLVILNDAGRRVRAVLCHHMLFFICYLSLAYMLFLSGILEDAIFCCNNHAFY